MILLKVRVSTYKRQEPSFLDINKVLQRTYLDFHAGSFWRQGLLLVYEVPRPPLKSFNHVDGSEETR